MSETTTPRDADGVPPITDPGLEQLLAAVKATTEVPWTPDVPPGTYVLLRGASFDGTTDYLVHLWVAEGTAQIDHRPAGSTATWRPVALDLVATQVISA